MAKQKQPWVDAKKKKRAKKEPPTIQWDPELPTIRAEIEAAIEKHAAVMARDPSPIQPIRPDGTQKLTKNAEMMFRLQLQLFRSVFGREPKKDEPIFWDRAKEHLGAFPIDTDEMHASIASAARDSGMRPAQAFALGVVGLPMTERVAEARPELAQWWEECVALYEELAAEGHPPVVPAELRRAMVAMNENAATGVTPITAAYVKAKNRDPAFTRMAGTVLDSVGDSEIAEEVLLRIATLVVDSEHLREWLQDPELMSDRGYSEPLLFAVATARIDPKTRLFDRESFAEQLAAFEQYEHAP